MPPGIAVLGSEGSCVGVSLPWQTLKRIGAKIANGEVLGSKETADLWQRLDRHPIEV